MTSSARVRIEGDSVMPSAFAIFRLITSSNLQHHSPAGYKAALCQGAIKPANACPNKCLFLAPPL
jgi:hypothetical protein